MRPYRQCGTERRVGTLAIADGAQGLADVGARNGDIGMIGAERRLPDFQCLAVMPERAVVAAALEQKITEVVPSRRHGGMRWAEGFLPNRARSLVVDASLLVIAAIGLGITDGLQ